MKKVINMNLSGRFISIEEDAYQSLQSYLDSLRNYFSNEESRDEIMSDIENRIAEIFSDKLKKGSTAINISDVEEVKDSMGRPEDFDTDNDNNSANYSNVNTNGGSQGNHVKRGRLYRDAKDKVLGGVCSGIANYFNIDVTIVRVIAVVLFFAAGTGFLLYLLLWLVIPEKEITTTVARRLFRNPDDRMIGGVCGGLASYFGVEVWIPRLIFAFPFIISTIVTVFNAIAWHGWGPGFYISSSFGGSMFIAYIVLWLLIPEATTTSDKMAMRGERADLNSIRNNVQEQMRQFGDRARQWGQEAGERARQWGAEASERSRQWGQEAGERGRQMGHGFGRILGLLIKGFILFIIGITAFSILIGLLAMVIGGVKVMPLSHFLFNGFWQTFLGWSSFIFIVIIPIISLIFFIRRRMSRKPYSKAYGIGLGILWIAGIVSCLLFAATMVRDFTYEAEADAVTHTLTQPRNNKLYVTVRDHNRAVRKWVQMGGLENVTEDSLQASFIRLNRTLSPDNQFHLVVKKISFGGTAAEAARFANTIQYRFSQNDSVLYLDGLYTIYKENKFRAQHVELELQVPAGAKTVIDNSVFDEFHYNYNSKWRRKRSRGITRYESNRNWEPGVEQTMDKDGVTTPDRQINDDYDDNDDATSDSLRKKELQQQLKDIDNREMEKAKQRKIDSIKRIRQREIDSIEKTGAFQATVTEQESAFQKAAPATEPYLHGSVIVPLFVF
jgi:phage shock protein PspC (stress-responsive transcriptional regulator)